MTACLGSLLLYMHLLLLTAAALQLLTAAALQLLPNHGNDILR
jgi:hypothetical protein